MPKVKQSKLVIKEHQDFLKPRVESQKHFDARNIKEFSITNKKIGEGYFGIQYIGRIVFEDGSEHRVAVKKFKRPLTKSEVVLYQ